MLSAILLRHARAAIFHAGNARWQDIELLNATLARLRQTFPSKPSVEIFAAVSRAHAAGEPLARIFERVSGECEIGCSPYNARGIYIIRRC